uniref:Tryptophanyl-tRNA synthetase n=1 Tax=Fagus sylvatica TaxID=28930 RepID=A0A2N9FEJ7_FAGSY
MGRPVLSHFLTLSHSCPRFTPSPCGGLFPVKYLKPTGLLPHSSRSIGLHGTGFRCLCSVSVSEPVVPDSSSSTVKKRIVSGVQPTGSIHLGNYLGAIKNWIPLQNTYDTLFFIVDLHAVSVGKSVKRTGLLEPRLKVKCIMPRELFACWKGALGRSRSLVIWQEILHCLVGAVAGSGMLGVLRGNDNSCWPPKMDGVAYFTRMGGCGRLLQISLQITLPYDAQQLSKATRDTAAIYLACGVDTSKASVFVQSHVRAHAELMWLLSSATPIGWLNRMIQFKEKSRKAGDENVAVALLTYPVLMASDILLYQSDFVPVGEDQKQHLELTRELAERVNYLYGGRKWKKLGAGGAIFKVPEPLIPPAGARVMSLSDGLSKYPVRYFCKFASVQLE